MSIALNEISRKKLILVKQLFQRATLQADTSHSFVDRILALISFDLATETCIKTVVSTLSSKPQSDRTFHDLIATANKHLGQGGLPLLPDEDKIRYAHDLRNDAQHKAKYPNENDLSDCRTYTRDFLRQLVKNVWNEAFDSVSLVDLVVNEDIRKLMQKAQGLFESDEFDEAVFYSIAAFDRVTGAIRSSIVGHSRLGRHDLSREDPLSQFDTLFKEIEALRSRLLFITLGLNIQQVIKYNTIVRGMYVHWLGGDKFAKTISRGPVTSSEASYVLDFVTNALVQTENLVGDIDKPFDIDSWY